MTTTAPFRLLGLLFLVTPLAAACGGTFVSTDEDGGTGGDVGTDGTGGTTDGGIGGSGNSTGGSSGGSEPGTGGEGAQTGTGGEPTVCCLAEATCDPYDLQLEPGEECPIGGECYTNTICCSTVTCMEEQALCDAIPVCQEGETEVPSCPEGSSCVKRALCGTVITCQTECEDGREPYREYVAFGADCQVVDYQCPEHTTSFTNECGCGCEQPETCPEFVDCMPGGQVDPLCSSDECPYTTRAL